MSGHLAIVAYRSLVAGIPSNRVDFQVRWFAEDDAAVVRRIIEAEPFLRYSNSSDEEVCWELVEVFAIEPFEPSESGEEIAGFIASTDELSELA
jgi:hypothetical protein